MRKQFLELGATTKHWVVVDADQSIDALAVHLAKLAGECLQRAKHEPVDKLYTP